MWKKTRITTNNGKHRSLIVYLYFTQSEPISSLQWWNIECDQSLLYISAQYTIYSLIRTIDSQLQTYLLFNAALCNDQSSGQLVLLQTFIISAIKYIITGRKVTVSVWKHVSQQAFCHFYLTSCSLLFTLIWRQSFCPYECGKGMVT